MAMNLHEVLEYLEGNFPVVYQSVISHLMEGEIKTKEAVIDRWTVLRPVGMPYNMLSTVISLLYLADGIWFEITKDANEGEIRFSHRVVSKQVAKEILQTYQKFHEFLQNKDWSRAQSVILKSSIGDRYPKVPMLYNEPNGHKQKEIAEKAKVALKKYFE